MIDGKKLNLKNCFLDSKNKERYLYYLLVGSGKMNGGQSLREDSP